MSAQTRKATHLWHVKTESVPAFRCVAYRNLHGHLPAGGLRSPGAEALALWSVWCGRTPVGCVASSLRRKCWNSIDALTPRIEGDSVVGIDMLEGLRP